MNTQEAFLKALAENENDATTRLVYADWLDEQGLHEEADRQRQWPMAREWLEKLCKSPNGWGEITYDELITFGREVAKEEANKERVYTNSTMWQTLEANSQEFWKNFTIVTGIPLPAAHESRGFHYWECCAHDISYWFGSPDRTVPEEYPFEEDDTSDEDAPADEPQANSGDVTP